MGTVLKKESFRKHYFVTNQASIEKGIKYKFTMKTFVTICTLFCVLDMAFHVKGSIALTRDAEECPDSHPFAYKFGTACCATQEERPLSGCPDCFTTPQSEIDSGACDGEDFRFTSVCCNHEANIPCHVKQCVDKGFLSD